MLNKKRPLKKSSTGLTLIEVLISLVVTLVLFLALMQSALLSIDANTTNLLREEAISIAEERMRELRDLSNTRLTAQNGVTEIITRNFRNFPVIYTQIVTVTAVGTSANQIEVSVTWEWKEKTVASGNPYTHAITTIKRG